MPELKIQIHPGEPASDTPAPDAKPMDHNCSELLDMLEKKLTTYNENVQQEAQSLIDDLRSLLEEDATPEEEKKDVEDMQKTKGNYMDDLMNAE